MWEMKESPDGTIGIAFKLIAWKGTPCTGSDGQAFLIDIYVLNCRFASGRVRSGRTMENTTRFHSSFLSCIPSHLAMCFSRLA